MPLFYPELEDASSRPEVVIMTSGPLFLRLGVPSGMEDLLEGLAREVLRHQPRDIYRFAAVHFEGLLLQRDTAHNAALSPSATHDQDGLNHNTEVAKPEEVITKVGAAPPVHSPAASDSGAASAASSPPVSPTRSPGPQSVRAKLTTTGDKHASPVFQQAIKAAFTAESLPTSPAKSEKTSPSPVSSPVSKSDERVVKEDAITRPASQSLIESKPTSPVENNLIKETSFSTVTSPDNKSSGTEEKISRFITTPVKEVTNFVFPTTDGSKSESTEGKSSPDENKPSSPVQTDDSKVEPEVAKTPEVKTPDESSEIKNVVLAAKMETASPAPQTEAEEVASKAESPTEAKTSAPEETAASPTKVEEIAASVVTATAIAVAVVTAVDAVGEASTAPEEVATAPDLEATQHPGPSESVEPTSVSTTSKKVSELGSEDFKPQTPEILIQSPDQSTCDDVSAAVLVEDDAEILMQPIEECDAIVVEAESPRGQPEEAENVTQEEQQEAEVTAEVEVQPTAENVDQEENIEQSAEAVNENLEEKPVTPVDPLPEVLDEKPVTPVESVTEIIEEEKRVTPVEVEILEEQSTTPVETVPETKEEETEADSQIEEVNVVSPVQEEEKIKSPSPISSPVEPEVDAEKSNVEKITEAVETEIVKDNEEVTEGIVEITEEPAAAENIEPEVTEDEKPSTPVEIILPAKVVELHEKIPVVTEDITENTETAEAVSAPEEEELIKQVVSPTQESVPEETTSAVDLIDTAKDAEKDEENLTEDKNEEAEPSQEAELAEHKITSPTPPPSPAVPDEPLDDVVQPAAQEEEHIDGATGEVEKVQSLSEEISQAFDTKLSGEQDSYPVPTTCIDFTPATPPQSPVNDGNEAEELITDGEQQAISQSGDIERDVTSPKQMETITEHVDGEQSKEQAVEQDLASQEETLIKELENQLSLEEGLSNETAKETGEILTVQSSTEQETVIQVIEEEASVSESQSSLVGNEGLGAVSSVVIRYSLSEANENPTVDVEEVNQKTAGDDEEKDEETLKEEQEIAETLIAAARESEETPPTETPSGEGHSISGADEVQPSVSEPAEVASIQTGSSKDATSLELDDVQKEAIVVEPIDLSALDESDKQDSMAEVSRSGSAAEQSRLAPESPQFHLEDISVDTAIQEMVESPSSEEQVIAVDSNQPAGEQPPAVEDAADQDAETLEQDTDAGSAAEDLVESPSSGEKVPASSVTKSSGERVSVVSHEPPSEVAALQDETVADAALDQHEERELEAAATKIQASFRGYQTRKALDVTELAQETLVPAVVARVLEEAEDEEKEAAEVWRAVPAKILDDDEQDEERLLSETDASLAEARARLSDDSPSAFEELVQSSTLVAATPLAYVETSPPTPAPHVSRLRNTYSSSGECADVSASVTEPISWNGGARVLDEESGELVTPDEDEGVWATLERELGETQENAATKIQAGYRGHRARQALLKRGDAVQIASSNASDVSNTPYIGVRHTGEFHDSLPLLPLAGDSPRELMRASSVGATSYYTAEADEDAQAERLAHENMAAKRSKDSSSPSENSESFLDRAATKIQATFRGFKTRNELKEKSPGRTPSPTDVNAATKIQAGFRGYQVRKGMKDETPKLARIQSAPQILICESEEERSATKIQAGVRGYLTRQRLKKERSPQPPPSPEPSAEVQDAVVKIQAGFRGYKARQDVKSMREGKDK